jgi:hypothetical protein
LKAVRAAFGARGEYHREAVRPPSRPTYRQMAAAVFREYAPTKAGQRSPAAVPICSTPAKAEDGSQGCDAANRPTVVVPQAVLARHSAMEVQQSAAVSAQPTHSSAHAPHGPAASPNSCTPAHGPTPAALAQQQDTTRYMEACMPHNAPVSPTDSLGLPAEKDAGSKAVSSLSNPPASISVAPNQLAAKGAVILSPNPPTAAAVAPKHPTSQPDKAAPTPQKAKASHSQPDTKTGPPAAVTCRKVSGVVDRTYIEIRCVH